MFGQLNKQRLLVAKVKYHLARHCLLFFILGPLLAIVGGKGRYGLDFDLDRAQQEALSKAASVEQGSLPSGRMGVEDSRADCALDMRYLERPGAGGDGSHTKQIQPILSGL